MKRQQRFALVEAPGNDDEATVLSQEVTQRFGREEWELISVVSLGNGVLLLAFQQAF